MDKETFLSCVGEALTHIDDPVWLVSSPLVGLLSSADATGEQLSRILVTAIKELRPSASQDSGSPEWRQHRHLLMRHVLGANPKQIAEEMSISDRQVRRDHLDALRALGMVLWRRYERQRGWSSIEETLGQGSPYSLTGVENTEHDEIIKDEVSRIGVTPVNGPTVLGETVQGILDTVSRLANSRSINFDTHLNGNNCLVAVDHTVLRQIFLNLLTLIIEGHSHTTIHLSTRENHEHVEVLIRIDCTEDVSQFAREDCSPASLDSDNSRLVVCHRLLTMQGGTLRFFDNANGSHTVVLSLPAAWSAKVLVIDDNPDFIRLFQRYLSDQSYRVHYTNTAERALDLAREVRPDVITLDVMMPSQDGWEILQTLKKDPATRDIPVIVCSVLREEALAMSLGAAAFLIKPVRQPALLAVLDRCCANATSVRRQG